jgi:hypothetical protein
LASSDVRDSSSYLDNQHLSCEVSNEEEEEEMDQKMRYQERAKTAGDFHGQTDEYNSFLHNHHIQEGLGSQPMADSSKKVNFLLPSQSSTGESRSRSKLHLQNLIKAQSPQNH